MSNTEIKFSTDGWHAKLNELFTEENLLRIAQAYVLFLKQKNIHVQPVAVGYDGRKNSKQYAELFSSVLSGNKIPVLLSQEILPTPVLSFAVKKFQCSAGVMITAGNHPGKYNGIKFKASYGGPFIGDEIKTIEKFTNTVQEIPRSTFHITPQDFLPPYKEHLQTIVNVDLLREYAAKPANNPNVMIDSMGGAGKTILEDILVECGWRAQTIFGTPEPNFYDRNPETIEENLQPLMYNTGITDAILGIATDGDGGGCAICSENGKWVSVQQTILLLAWHLYKNKNLRGAIIKSVPVTDRLRLLAEKRNLPFFEVNVSFQNITRVMLQNECLVGADDSAGFSVHGHIPERDGILSGLLFCEMLAQSGKSVDEIWKEIENEIG